MILKRSAILIVLNWPPITIAAFITHDILKHIYLFLKELLKFHIFLQQF